MNKTKFNTEEEKEFLKQAIDMVESKAFSLRAACDWLQVKTGVSMSYEGLRKRMNKVKEEPEDERLGEESRELPEG